MNVDKVKPLAATCTWSGLGSIGTQVLSAFAACSCRAQDFQALLQQEPLLKCLDRAACGRRVGETFSNPMSRGRPSLPPHLARCGG